MKKRTKEGKRMKGMWLVAFLFLSSFIGYCACGTTVKCTIDNETYAEEVCIICVVNTGQKIGKCRKRYLRAPLRHEIGQELLTKGAELYRTEQGAKRMKIGDPEPGNLPKASTLRTVKVDYKNSTYLHPDPIKALQIMKHTTWNNSIHSIGQDPFLCHFWTPHQTRLYFNYARKEKADISIDASGGMIKSLDVFDGETTGPIYLYLVVVNDDAGQYSVSQMISSTHNTISILHFLNEWVRLGAPHPKVVNCDGSKALLTAIIRAFTRCQTIKEYTEACQTENLPECYVRLDAAHFLKLYADFLGKITTFKKVKIFYKAVIGQLMLCRDLKNARKILKAIMMVSQSESDGYLSGSNLKTSCEEQRNFLKTLIDPRELVDTSEDTMLHDENSSILPGDESILDHEFEKDYTNFWSIWFDSVNNDVQQIVKREVGEHDNAYYLPKLTERLKNDIKWLPLWSCILRDKYGYGKIPGSSSTVESQFKNVKQDLFSHQSSKMRPDVFVDALLQYTVGRSLLIEAKEIELENESTICDLTVHEMNACETNSSDCYNESSLQELTGINKNDRIKDSDLSKKVDINRCQLCETILDSDVCNEDKDFCKICASIESAPQIIASRSEENWRGLTTKHANKVEKSRTKSGKLSRYLDKNQETHDALSHDKLKCVPLLKNGNDTNLKAINMKKTIHSFSNTCPFDSIIQTLLVAAIDDPKVENSLNELRRSGNSTLDLVMYIKKNGTQNAYGKRGTILKEIIGKLYPRNINEVNGSVEVDCWMNVAVLAQRLFEDLPNGKVVLTCNNGCPRRERDLIDISLPNELLRCSASGEDIYNYLKNSASCVRVGCRGINEKSYEASGPFLFMSITNPDELVNVGNVPTSFPDLVGTEKYILLGIIRFIPGGHYTSVCRRNNVWYEFNDLHTKIRKLSSKNLIMNIALLIYNKM